MLQSTKKLPLVTRTTCLFTTLITTTGLGALSSNPTSSAFLSTFSPSSCPRAQVRSKARSGVNRHLSSARMSASNAYGGGEGVTVEAINSEASGLVIFLHGLGDSGRGWSSAFPMPNIPHVKAILPNAPYQPVSLNGGMRMPSWFDLHGLDENSADDESGIERAVQRVERIVDASNIPSERVVIAGFSQGGALALTTVLRSQRKYAGCIALSTWLPLRHTYPDKFGPHARNTPVFYGHGQDDPLVRFMFGKQASNLLNGWGVQTTFKGYESMGHSACAEELDDVSKFLGRVMPGQ